MGAPDIYFSYAREDQTRVAPLVAALEARGWSVFWDQRIPPGETWRSHIGAALHQARCVVVAWSERSIQSEWVIEEADEGRERGILVPAFIDPVRPPRGFRGIQAADLSGWSPERPSPAFDSFLADLGGMLGISEQAAETLPYFDTRGGRRPLNEAKLILVGFGGVGKTSLVNRLILDRPFCVEQNATEGIAICDWRISLPHTEEVRLHVWDFGGQEIMHATHQFFLTASSLYILVLNGRQGREDADAEYWINMIKNYALDSPAIIVLNKIKSYWFNVNRQALQAKFPQIRAFVETDFADDTGLDELGRIVRLEVDRLPNLRDSYPAAWFSIRDRLENMSREYLAFSEFRRVCSDYGENIVEDQERIGSFLHKLGVVLNYRDDPRLQDTHVLKPQWVTEGVYTILNAKQIALSMGELDLNDLKLILNPEYYPPAQQPFLLELMRKFELCFRFPDNDNRFLIPELLDKQEPSVVRDLEADSALRFEYHYAGQIPEGLIPRFIVRTSALSYGQPRWRTGVVLTFEGNRALVKADPVGRKVHVYVHGPSQGRRRLLAIVRSDFEQIHRSYASKPREMVPVPERPGIVVPYEKLLIFEMNGKSKLEEVFGEEILSLSVSELLDGVDLAGVRIAGGKFEQPRRQIAAFISYSHVDQIFRDELEVHLKLLQREGLLYLWSDRRIVAGEDWREEIDENFERADIIILLVSANFIGSGYCWDVELRRAMEKHSSGQARVVPILIRQCSWQSAPFSKLQVLPGGGKPVALWGNEPFARDVPWTVVEKGIRDLVLSTISGGPRTPAQWLRVAGNAGSRWWNLQGWLTRPN